MGEKNQCHVREELNGEQKRALNRMMGGENIFLTGEAGTGKSFLLRCFIEQVQHKNVVICAPTGIAAIQIGGATIHRTFGAKLGPVAPTVKIKRTNEAIDVADIIIIDEISMCRFDLFEYVCRYIQKSQKLSNRKKQLVVCGDFYQLPPVMTSEDRNNLEELWGEEKVRNGFAFMAPAWKEMNFCNIVLKKVMRQKDAPDFLENLNKIRHGDASVVKWFNEHAASEEQEGIYLYGINANVCRKNEEEISQLREEIHKYFGENHDFGKDLPTNEVLELCVGAKVMGVINDSEDKFQNGSLGVVRKIKSNSVIVDFDNGKTVEVKPHTWEAEEYYVEKDETTGNPILKTRACGKFTQLPLKIAFAVTIHKSQGQTYTSANINPYCFTHGQLYVALSRVPDIHKLHLLSRIKPSDVKVSQEVNHFFENIKRDGD